MKRIVLVLCVGLLAAIAVPNVALAEERTCRGTIQGRTLDNVRVPQGAECTLIGTTVKGTIKVERGAVLDAVNVKVIGNVQGENARSVTVRKTSEIGGSVQVVQGNAARVIGSKVGADILYDEQSGRVVVRRTTVGGNVQAFQNTGGVRIVGNDIDGNLQCKANVPAPTGEDNRVGGNKEDQCRSL